VVQGRGGRMGRVGSGRQSRCQDQTAQPAEGKGGTGTSTDLPCLPTFEDAANHTRPVGRAIPPPPSRRQLPHSNAPPPEVVTVNINRAVIGFP
jgi:hypothetical protein